MPLWLVHRRRSQIEDRGLARTIRTEAVVAVLFTIVILMLVVFLRIGMKQIFGESSEPPVFWEGVDGPVISVWLLVILGVSFTLTPVAEELFFRGFLYHALQKAGGPWTAAIGQAVLFMLVHPFGRSRWATYFFLALMLLFIYRHRRTLVTPILVHGLFNAVMSTYVIHSALFPGPYLGLAGETHEHGMVVTNVAADSPADEAGLREGDVITGFGGEPVGDAGDLIQLLREREPGDVVEVEFLRDGESQTVEVRLISMNDRFSPEEGPPKE